MHAFNEVYFFEIYFIFYRMHPFNEVYFIFIFYRMHPFSEVYFFEIYFFIVCIPSMKFISWYPTFCLPVAP